MKRPMLLLAWRPDAHHALPGVELERFTIGPLTMTSGSQPGVEPAILDAETGSHIASTDCDEHRHVFGTAARHHAG